MSDSLAPMDRALRTLAPLRTLALYTDAIRGMRARQLAYRVRRIVPLRALALGTEERAPPSWRPLATGLGVDHAPQSGQQAPPEETGAFAFVGITRMFEDGSNFWNAGDEGLLFAFHLHEFGELARYADGRRTARGDAFWVGVLTSWLRRAGRPSRPGWHPYPMSGRIIAWSAALSAGGWPPELEHRMRCSIVRQAAVLSRCIEHDIGGNHVLRNATASIFAGACLGDDRALGRAMSLMRRELSAQLLADGGHEERSTAYHRAVRSDLDDLATLLERAHGVGPAWLMQARERMRRWECAMRCPDGRLPLLNDAWDGPPEAGRRVTDAVTVLGESGYVVLRNAGDQLILDAGPIAPPHLPPHAHADVLSFVLWADGRPLIVDPGTFAYTGPQRAAFRSTASHNTVEVDGADQCEFWGDFRATSMPRIVRLDVLQRGDAVLVAARHDGYRRLADAVEHERWVWWLPGDGVVIVDRLHAARSHGVRSRIHLAPGVRAMTPHACGPFAVDWLGPGLAPAVAEGAYSPYLGTQTPIDVLEREASVAPGDLFGYAILRPGAVATLRGRTLTVTRRDGARAEVELR